MKVVLKKSQTSASYFFSFNDSKDRSVVRSESYKARKSALNGIASVRKNSLNDIRYVMKKTKNGKFFFNLKAANGQIVGTSAFYASPEERSKFVAIFKIQALDAAMQEQRG